MDRWVWLDWVSVVGWLVALGEKCGRLIGWLFRFVVSCVG